MTYSLNTLNTSRADAAQPRPGVARFAHEIALVLGLVALVFWLLALVSYSRRMPPGPPPARAVPSATGGAVSVRGWRT
jgi:S-DNA-T family DNA segregation ATPase FtsK/SpoIIIE